MKRLWIAAALLCAVFAATLWNGRYLRDLTEELSGLLTRAEFQAEKDNWEEASLLTQQAREKWESRDCYLHVMLRHSDTDEIHAGFREVQEFINCREGGEYSAANARLIAQIELLYESEQLTLKNVL